jgi:guanylate kinase
VFLLPPSEEELERRLRQRGTETEQAIQNRLARAKQELAVADQYHYRVVNDDPDRAAREILQILKDHSPPGSSPAGQKQAEERRV